MNHPTLWGQSSSAAGQEQPTRSRFMPGGGVALLGLHNTGINLI